MLTLDSSIMCFFFLFWLRSTNLLQCEISVDHNTYYYERCKFSNLRLNFDKADISSFYANTMNQKKNNFIDGNIVYIEFKRITQKK